MDNLGFTVIITLLVYVFWFFGIHDAALSGMLGPIRDGNLSINAVAHAAGEALPAIFTTPLWVYFVIIGGGGTCLLRDLGAGDLWPAADVEPGVLCALYDGLRLKRDHRLPGHEPWDRGEDLCHAFLADAFRHNGAFFSTMDWKAPVLIVILTVIDGLIYFPFFKMYEKTMVKMDNGEENQD